MDVRLAPGIELGGWENYMNPGVLWWYVYDVRAKGAGDVSAQR
jgi:hypothetical protein